MARSQPLYDSDPDTEPDTPKPQRTATRKRLSEAHNPDFDASFGSDSGVRAHKSSVDINDDAAEKRRRRKSTKIAVSENAQAGPSSEGNDDQADTSRSTKQKQQLTTVAPMAPPEKETINAQSMNVPPAQASTSIRYQYSVDFPQDNQMSLGSLTREVHTTKSYT